MLTSFELTLEQQKRLSKIIEKFNLFRIFPDGCEPQIVHTFLLKNRFWIEPLVQKRSLFEQDYYNKLLSSPDCLWKPRALEKGLLTTSSLDEPSFSIFQEMIHKTRLSIEEYFNWFDKKDLRCFESYNPGIKPSVLPPSRGFVELPETVQKEVRLSLTYNLPSCLVSLIFEYVKDVINLRLCTSYGSLLRRTRKTGIPNTPKTKVNFQQRTTDHEIDQYKIELQWPKVRIQEQNDNDIWDMEWGMYPKDGLGTPIFKSDEVHPEWVIIRFLHPVYLRADNWRKSRTLKRNNSSTKQLSEILINFTQKGTPGPQYIWNLMKDQKKNHLDTFPTDRCFIKLAYKNQSLKFQTPEEARGFLVLLHCLEKQRYEFVLNANQRKNWFLNNL
jgi:hypothetical protein